MLDLKGRNRVAPYLDAIAAGMAKIGFTPTAVTVLGLAVTVGGSVLIATGRLAVGAAVAGFGAVLDAFDGPIARLQGKDGIRGAFVDTMADRFGEVAILAGVAYYLRLEPLGLMLCVTALALSLLIPYIRAKAEALGVEGRGGWMGRAERMILALVGVGLAGLWRPFLYPTLWVFVILSGLTVAQRIRRTWQQLPE